jgi:RsiW-degrading membrane proteinase PrsW (M82 family)
MDGASMSGTWLLISAIAITVVPALIYIRILWFVDRYEKEPASLLGAALLGGAIVAPILTWLVEQALGIPNSIFPALFQIYPVGTPSFEGAAIEEVAKGAVIAGAYVFFRREFDGTLDGVVYGAAVGAGFALAESATFLRDLVEFGQAARFGAAFFIGIFLSGLTQCVFSGIFGASLGYVRETSPRGSARVVIPLIGLAVVVLYHLGYVAAGAAGQVGVTGTARTLLAVGRRAADWAGLALLGAVVAWAWSRERAILRWGLADEVPSGALTREELAAFGTGRPLMAAGALRAALAELAFAKWRAARGLGSAGDVRRQRERVLALRAAKEPGR